MVLEREGHARARGAPILGVLSGYGSASEGANALLLDKEGKGLARAIEAALRDSGMRPNDLDCIHCHGVGLEIYDRCEVNAYKIALEDYAYRLPLTATKSMIGQAYSAGGLFSVVGALLSLNSGAIPPTLNLLDPYPDCDLDFTPLCGRINDVQGALVTALSFGGTHAAVALQRLN